MKVIFNIVALPITLAISAVCFFFTLLFESDFKSKDGVGPFARIWRQSQNLMLAEGWGAIPVQGRAAISLFVYYIILS